MTVETRARVWGRMQAILALVNQDGTIRVWDDVAGHFTTCHTLSLSACRRIRKLAWMA